jgi:hypothetical protein
MEIEPPTPNTTLAILLGASKFPESKRWDENPCFARSSEAFHRYLAETCRLRREQTLYLFDREEEANAIDKRIVEFLQERVENADDDDQPRDLVVHYVGHGCSDDGNFCLSLNTTRDDNVLLSSLPASSLLRTIDKHARKMRRYFIIDCCFARELLKSAMADESALARQFWPGQAPAGSALLSAASEKETAVGDPDAPLTLFTGTLIEVLEEGDPDIERPLSLRDVCPEICRRIQASDRDYKPRPHLDSPKQTEGDVSTVPLFPNPAWRPVPVETLEEVMGRVLGDYRQTVQDEWQARWSEVVDDDASD